MSSSGHGTNDLHGPPMQAPSGRVIQGGASDGEPKSGHATSLAVRP